VSRWAERDAERLERRIRHLVAARRRRPGDDELAYLRRHTLLLLTADVELPDEWRDDLRELDRILDRIQRGRRAAA
jgi:hypothetical protein